MEHHFNWLHFVPGLGALPPHVASSIFVALVLVVLTWIARIQLSRAIDGPGGGLVPDEKLTFRNFFEIAAEALFNLTKNVIGDHDAPKYFPLIGTLFVYIFVSNLLGLIPGFHGSTDNLNTTVSMGLFVFFYYNYVGFKEHGAGYLKHFLGPLLPLAPLMLVIELFSHIFRPISLGLRLFANMTGDHKVLGVFSELVPVVVPSIFYGIGLFVCFIQAFVFCLMTMVYISLSTSHDH